MTTITKKEYRHIYDIIGACLEVHKVIGRGLAEPIYQEVLALEFMLRNIVNEREKKLTMKYKGITLKKEYFADFICEDVVVELKAVDEICSDHRAQLMNYMRITNLRKGLLVNFGEKSLRVERYLYDDDDDDFVLLTRENIDLYVDK